MRYDISLLVTFPLIARADGRKEVRCSRTGDPRAILKPVFEIHFENDCMNSADSLGNQKSLDTDPPYFAFGTIAIG